MNAGLNVPGWLVTGDLGLLHDSNGLLGAANEMPGLFVILINNNGGGIFELLPTAKGSADFERFFATPQDVDFQKLVEAQGGEFTTCSTVSALKSAITSWDGKGLVVAEIPIDREASAVLHRQFLKLG